MKTLKEKWEEYKKMVYSEEIPSYQNRECSMAFMAGAAGMFGLMYKASELPEDKAVIEVEKLRREMQHYKNFIELTYKK
jgi:hypothetical protein